MRRSQEDRPHAYPKIFTGETMKIYFQTQFYDDQKNHVHSDGCCDLDKDIRNFFHRLLDEWLDNQRDDYSRNPEENSFELKVCSCHD